MLAPGTLCPALERATQHALACGALRPIETAQQKIEDAGIEFVIRWVSSLARKTFEQARGAPSAAAAVNPFLPFDPNLFVADVSATHVALLNKFNLVANHLIIATRRFVPQEVLLDGEDLAALCACLAQLDGLGFYNAGAAAGASQPHKHLQMIPLPLESGGASTPIDEALSVMRDRRGILTAPGLPFRHSFAWLEDEMFQHPLTAAARMASLYADLLAGIGVKHVVRDGLRYTSAPWNLLVTRRWMLLVPRLSERFEGVAINALGFAGSLFVRDDVQLETIKRAGPMAALRAVSGSLEMR
jgi:sulfate adenylyltransferase (ADP) / ATP adenylyltransferase